MYADDVTLRAAREALKEAKPTPSQKKAPTHEEPKISNSNLEYDVLTKERLDEVVKDLEAQKPPKADLNF